MLVYNSTKARKDFFHILKLVNDNQIVTITSKHGNAVLLSQDDWDAIKETLYLASDPELAKSIKDGLKEPLDNCSDKLEW